MAEIPPSSERIAEHRVFLAKITAEARKSVMSMLNPRYLLAAGHEIDALVRAAQEEVAFLHRVGLDPDDPDGPSPSEET